MRQACLVAALGLAGAVAAGCVTGQEPAAEQGLVACEAPRPEVCPMNYDPVCGQGADGTRRTYSNDCGACADASVVGYRPGACPEEESMEERP